MRRLLALALAVCSAACGGPSVVVVMEAQNNSGQAGSAHLQETGEGLRVEVVIRKGGDSRSQPVHIHEGRCGEIGPALSLYPGSQRSVVLDTMRDPDAYGLPADGGTVMSRTVLKEIRLSDINDGGWVINVHDIRDNALYVSCGDIN